MGNWQAPPNIVAAEKVKQAGLNARHRSIAEEIGLQVVNTALSLGGSYVKDYITGGPEKREILGKEAESKQQTANAAMMEARSKAMTARSGQDLAWLAQEKMIDPATGLPRPGYDVQIGDARFITPDAAPPPSQKDWIWDEKLKNPDGSLGGMRPRTQSEWESYNKSKLPRRGSTVRTENRYQEQLAGIALLGREIAALEKGPMSFGTGSPAFVDASQKRKDKWAERNALYKTMGLEGPTYAEYDPYAKPARILKLQESLPLSGWNKGDLKRFNEADMYGDDGILNDMVSKFSSDYDFMLGNPYIAWPTPGNPEQVVAKDALLDKVSGMSRAHKVEFFRQLSEEAANGNGDASIMLEWIRFNM